MIQFKHTQKPEYLRMAYNNDTFRFYSDTVSPSYAEVLIQGETTIRLYANPEGIFYCNLKPYIAAMINTQNFEDTTLTSLIVTDPGSFTYMSNEGRLFKASVEFKIVQNTGDDLAIDTTSMELEWLAGAQQYGEFRILRKDDLLILTPPLPHTVNNWYIKYWEGYPFDISFYSNRETIKLLNTSNLLNGEFNTEQECTRLFFSDGRTDVTLEDFIPMNTGINLLELTRENDGNIYNLTVDKANGCKGIYLKWFNAQGGYSYWLFENTYAIDRVVKSLGELNRDFNNLEYSLARTVQIGQQVQDTIKVVAELLTPPQRNIVQNLLESPKVYLFTGTPYGRTNYHDWVEVAVKTNTARIKNSREELTNFSLDLELPERYTITL
jgi:hypothetical protein